MEARGVAIDDEGGDPHEAHASIDGGEDQEDICVWRVRRERLRAVEHVLLAVTPGGCPQAERIGPGSGLRHAVRSDPFATAQARQVALPLRLVTEPQDRHLNGPHLPIHGEQQAAVPAAPAKALHEQHRPDDVDVTAAVLGGEGGALDAERRAPLPQITREGRVPISGDHIVGKATSCERDRLVPEGELLRREGQVHRRGARSAADAGCRAMRSSRQADRLASTNAVSCPSVWKCSGTTSSSTMSIAKVRSSEAIRPISPNESMTPRASRSSLRVERSLPEPAAELGPQHRFHSFHLTHANPLRSDDIIAARRGPG